jgi:hypothetical protein
MKNRELLRPGIHQIRPDFVEHGKQIIQSLIETLPISGFKHPASTLFWFYWSHVFSQHAVLTGKLSLRYLVGNISHGKEVNH